MENANVQVSKETHLLLKVYCARNQLSMRDFVDKIICERILEEENNKNMLLDGEHK